MKSWFEKLVGTPQVETVSRETHNTKWHEAQEDLQGAIATLMNYAMNTPDGRAGVREVGEKMTMQMLGVEVQEVGTSKNKDLGDFELTITRIR